MIRIHHLIVVWSPSLSGRFIKCYFKMSGLDMFKRKFTKTGAQEYLVKSHTALRVELHFFPQCIILITNMLV